MARDTRRTIRIGTCIARMGLLAILLGLQAALAWGAAPTMRGTGRAPMTVIPTDGFNLVVLDQVPPEIQKLDLALSKTKGHDLDLLLADELNPTLDATLPERLYVTLATPAHNWFAVWADHIPTDVHAEIVLCMTGNDTTGNVASVSKWHGLRPVMTYGDPTQYATYEWFQKDADGRWVSGDPFKQGDARYAGAGKTPEQTVIPADVAEEFLSTDGTYWSPWREIDTVSVEPKANIFRIRHRFTHARAAVCMRVPYTYAYLQAYLQRVDAAKKPGVTVHHIGATPEGRDLTVIQIDDPDPSAATKDRPVVVLYGNEDGDEADSAWVTTGAINWLLSEDPQAQAIRQQTTFLCIPQFDVDGGVHSTYGALTKAFYVRTVTDPVRDDVLAYTRFFSEWVGGGRRLDVACAFHNVECSEAPNVLCPFIDLRRAKTMHALNRFMLERLSEYQVSRQTWMTGFADDRFNGWCNRIWGTIVIAYEVNSRYPAQRLRLAHLQQMGPAFVRGFAEYVGSPLFAQLAPTIDQQRTTLQQRRAAYWKRHRQRDRAQRSPHAILSLGY